MKVQRRLAGGIPAAVLLFFSFPVVASAQRGAPTAPQQPTATAPNLLEPSAGSAGITVNVYDEHGLPIEHQALVELDNTTGGSPIWTTTGIKGSAIFSTVPGGDYQVKVSASGYKTASLSLHIFDMPENYQENVTLVSEGGVAPPPLTAGQLAEPKVRKEAEKGITSIKAGNYSDAQKHLEKALKADPKSAGVNYLLGYLYMQKKDFARAESYLKTAISLDPKQAKSMTLIGEMHLERKDPTGAVPPLEQAVKADPSAWAAHWFLADAYFERDEFDLARQQAQLALDTGKGAAKGANLILGQSYANTGRVTEAVQSLQLFVQDFPKSSVAPQVRDLIARLKDETAATQASLRNVSDTSRIAEVRPAAASPAVLAMPSLPGWAPDDVDEETLVVSKGVACPADRVIGGASKRAADLVDNISRFGARETMLHEDLDDLGGAVTKETRKYNYIAQISEPKPGLLMIDEYRTGISDVTGFPDHIATIGLPGLAMVFHPDLRGDFDMVCEGLGDWKGQATWLVHFRQKADRPSHVQTYELPSGDFPVALKGRAWIAAGTFQIVHMETDLVAPMPSIRLLTEHQSVDYGPVEFKQKKMQVWLPKQADLYFQFRGRRYYRRHSFDHYILFFVGDKEKIRRPKGHETDQTVASTPGSTLQ